MSAYSTNAKQILHGKQHIADCINAETATLIVRALNGPSAIAAHLEMEAKRRAKQRTFARALRFAAQEVRAGMWEADHIRESAEMVGEQANG